jgi:hypothetical protein
MYAKLPLILLNAMYQIILKAIMTVARKDKAYATNCKYCMDTLAIGYDDKTR